MILLLTAIGIVGAITAYLIGKNRGHALGFYQGMRIGIVIGRERQNLVIASRNPAWLIPIRNMMGTEAVEELIELAESDEP